MHLLRWKFGYTLAPRSFGHPNEPETLFLAAAIECDASFSEDGLGSS